jgi:pyruvate formate lyase activating enzyme
MTDSFDMRGFIPNSLLEWEDHVACVGIAGGCNFRCPYCHSWRYVTGVESLARRDVEEVFELLRRQRGWIDGVVFTGGEPCLQAGLPDLARRVKAEFGLPVKLHTNGTRPGVVEGLLAAELVDCLALDYKAPLDEGYFSAAGIRENPLLLDSVRESFALAAGAACAREYHTTLCPAVVDAETFGEMAEALETGGTWFLQQYESGDCLDPAAAGAARYTNEELDVFFAGAKEHHTGGSVILKRGSSA